MPEVSAGSVVRVQFVGELLGQAFGRVVHVKNVFRIVWRILQLAQRERAGPLRRVKGRPPREHPINTDGFATPVILEGLVG